MTNIIKITLLALLTLMITACSSIRVSQDYTDGTDFSGYQTYRWNPEVLKTEQKIENNNPLLNSRIHSAIDNKLAAMGYRLTDSEQADFTVSYQTGVHSRIRSDGTTGVIAIGYGGIGRYGSLGISTGTNIREKDEATLIVDIIDNPSKKLVWRGISTRNVYAHNSPEKLTKTINTHIDAILSQFPPGSKQN